MAITVERVGNRIHIKPTTYLGGDKFAAYLYRVKQVPGSTYSAKLKLQTAPLDLEVCRMLREQFGGALEIGPELTAWAQAEREKEAAVMAIHDIDLGDFSTDVDLPRVRELAPTMWKAMQDRKFQPVASHFGATVGSHLNADAVGLGKSIETFGALVERGIRGPVLLFAPPTALRATWLHEIQKWLGDLGAAAWVCDTTPAKRPAIIQDFMENRGQEYFDFLLVNPEMLRLTERYLCPSNPKPDPFMAKGRCDGRDPYCDRVDEHTTIRQGTYPELFDVPWAAQVGDEMHKLMVNANPKALKRVSQVGLGIQRVPLAPDGVRVALTGTPMKGKPLRLWPVLHWLRPDYYSAEGRYKEQYLESVPDAYAYSGKKFLDIVRPDREAAYHRELAKIMIRRTKEELRLINPAWAPPDPYDNDVWVTLGAKQRKQYDQMAKSGQLDIGPDTLLASGTLAERTRLRQLAGCCGSIVGDDFKPVLPSAKFDWLVEFLASLGITKPEDAQGEAKVVVASQFTQFINLWAAKLETMGIPNFVLTGETGFARRAEMKDEFQKPGGPRRVFLLNTHAGGTSLTLDAADDVVLMDETDNPDDQAQVIGRVHRTSRTDHQVNIWRIFAEGTIEEDIRMGNIGKDANQRKHLDERRGVVFVRRTKSGE